MKLKGTLKSVFRTYWLLEIDAKKFRWLAIVGRLQGQVCVLALPNARLVGMRKWRRYGTTRNDNYGSGKTSIC